VAFANVKSAMNWCIESQTGLLNIVWDAELLAQNQYVSPLPPPASIPKLQMEYINTMLSDLLDFQKIRIKVFYLNE
jgi:hypothetical protein